MCSFLFTDNKSPEGVKMVRSKWITCQGFERGKKKRKKEEEEGKKKNS